MTAADSPDLSDLDLYLTHPELIDALHHKSLVKGLGDVKIVVLGCRPPLLLRAQAAVERVLGGWWLVIGGCRLGE